MTRWLIRGPPPPRRPPAGWVAVSRRGSAGCGPGWRAAPRRGAAPRGAVRLLAADRRVVGRDAGQRLADDQAVDVVRPFIGVDRLDVQHVADHRVVVDDAVGAEHLAGDAGALAGQPDVVSLAHRDVERLEPPLVLELAELQAEQLPPGDLGGHPRPPPPAPPGARGGGLGPPWSLSLPSCRRSSCPWVISVAIQASFSWTSWWAPIGWPWNCTRSLAYWSAVGEVSMALAAAAPGTAARARL